MTTRWIIGAALAALIVAAAAASPGAAWAQSFDTDFAGLAADTADPIEIEADELEVRDRDGVAVFSGNVTVRQQKSALKTQRLTVHYLGGGQRTALLGGASDGAPGGAGASQEIARLEASGKVLVTSEGQAATGDSGVIDMQAREMVLAGNVTLTQGENVITGDRLVVDLKSGRATVESSSRVRMLLTPNARRN